MIPLIRRAAVLPTQTLAAVALLLAVGPALRLNHHRTRRTHR